MTSSDIYQSSREKLEQFLLKQGKSLTQEREIILQAVCEMKRPFVTAELVEVVSKQHISRATVYNNLPLLTNAGVLHCVSRQAGRRKAQFELIMGSHNSMQLICRRCGRVAEFREVAIENIARQRKYNNFLMEHFSMVVYGTCKTCRKKHS